MGRGRLPSAAMERFLGKLCWLGRPNAGLGAFLAGAYSSLQRGFGLFWRGVAKGVATVLLFSCIPQQADPLGQSDTAPWEVFTDAAPEGSGFRVGVVGEKGFYRSQRCPPGSSPSNRPNCLRFIWWPSWPLIVGVRVLG